MGSYLCDEIPFLFDGDDFKWWIGTKIFVSRMVSSQKYVHDGRGLMIYVNIGCDVVGYTGDDG